MGSSPIGATKYMNIDKQETLLTINTEAFWTWRKLKKYRKLQRPIVFPPNLTGMCALGSVALFKRLKFDLKIDDIKFIVGSYKIPGDWYTYCHCWLRYKDYVIDITASQFDEIRNSIVIDKESNAFYLEKFSNRRVYEDIANIKAYFDKAGWIHSQNPFMSKRKGKLKFNA